MFHEQIAATNDENLRNSLQTSFWVCFHYLVPLAQEGYWTPRTYARQGSEIREHKSCVWNLGREEEPCSADGNIQIPQQLLQTPARAFLQEEWREDERTLSETIQKRARLNQKKNFFPVKIVGKWNVLPANVIEAATIGSFKRILVNHRRSLVTPDKLHFP